MRFLVLGAGAIGGYFGARLAAAGNDVTFLVREKRQQVLRERGLIVKSPVGDLKLDAKTVTRADAAYDVVLLTCKAYDLDGAIDAIAPAVGPASLVVPLLNGMRHLEVLDARFGAEHVTGGLAHVGLTLSDEGDIVHLSPPAHFAIGARFSGQEERVAAIHALLLTGGFKPVLSKAIIQEMWDKFVFIAAYAGITSLMRAPIGKVATADDGAAIATELFFEGAQVAAAAGYPLSQTFIDKALPQLTDKSSPGTSSMFRDVRRGARTEHEHILGDLLRRARENGQSTPVLRIARAHLQTYEATLQ